MPDRRVSVTIDADTGPYARGLAAASAETRAFSRQLQSTDTDTDRFGRTLQTSGAEIDRYSGRLRVLGEAVAVLGPGLIPIGAATVPLVTTLANQLGFAAIAGGSALLAFRGVGTALDALNTYQLEPSAANMAKLDEAMRQLSPAARDFTRELQSMRPLLDQLSGSAAAGLFPGLTEGLQALSQRAPQVNRIVREVSDTLGDLLAEGGRAVAGSDWDEFFAGLQNEARPALTDMAHGLGAVTHGLTQLWDAFLPIDHEMSAGMVRLAHGFDDWATGLDQTEGFQNFLDYVHQTGPQVLNLLGSLGNMFVQIAQAAAPLGGPVLQSLTAIADAIASIADSPLGTPIFTALAALSLYNRALAVTKSESLAAFGPKVKANVTSFGMSIRGMSTELQAANARLLTAQTEMRATAVRARDAQFALIPTAQKRAALNEYVVAQGRVKTAAAEVTEAESRAAAARRSSLATLGKSAAAVGGLALVASGTADKIGLTNTATLALAGSFAGPLGTAIGGGIGLFMDASAAASDLGKQLDVVAHSDNIEKIQANLTALEKKRTDLTHYTGVGDFFSDTTTQLGQLIHGNFSAIQRGTGSGLTKSIDAAKKRLADLRYQAGQDFFKVAHATDAATLATQRYDQSLQDLQNRLQNRSAYGQYLQSLIDTRKAIKENGDAFRKNGRLIDRSNAKNVASFNQLTSLAGAMQNELSHLNGPAQRSAMKRMSGEFVALAMQMGMGRDAAERLARKLLHLDQIKPNPKVDLDDKNAKNKLAAMNQGLDRFGGRTATATLDANAGPALAATAAVQRALAALHDKTVTLREVHEVSVYTKMSGNRSTFENARGGVYHYAAGDIANHHQPELAGPGPMRVWREPETQGEAYIPLANDSRRPRAQAIASETVRLLGGAAYFAQGGFSQHDVSSAAPARFPSSFRATFDVGDGITLVGLMEAVADDRIGAHGNLEGMATRAGAR